MPDRGPRRGDRDGEVEVGMWTWRDGPRHGDVTAMGGVGWVVAGHAAHAFW